MKHFIFYILINVILLSNPIYSDSQIKILLENHYLKLDKLSKLSGIHIYKDKEGKAIQLDFDCMKTNKKNVISTMNIISKIAQFAKKPFYKFIIIEHLPDQKIPIGYESNANCTIDYFINNNMSKSEWEKDCFNEGILSKTINNWIPLKKKKQ